MVAQSGLEIGGRIEGSDGESGLNGGRWNHWIRSSRKIGIEDDEAHAGRLGQRVVVVRVRGIGEAGVLHDAALVLAGAALPRRETGEGLP